MPVKDAPGGHCHAAVMSLPYTMRLEPGPGRGHARPARTWPTPRNKRVTSILSTPGDRLAQLARTELEELQRQLVQARRGRDRALHKARKTLQRLRAIVRLLAPLDPVLAARENQFLRRLRRRLGPLRDAAARRQTFQLLASRPRWRAHVRPLRQLAQEEAEHHALAWADAGADAPLWRGVDRQCEALARRLPQWPFARLDRSTLDRALADARQQARRRIRAAAGRHGRELRHELRRKLRRYANLARAAAVARGRPGAEVATLLALAKRCGHEGDMWMAVSSARRVARGRPAFRPVLRALEEERRAACRRHDRQLQRAGLD